MAEIDRYEPGSPCWVDVVTRDVETSAAFYSALFGWQREPSEDGFGLFTLDGLVVAGIGPCRPDQNPVWSTYISVADVDATVAVADKAGGTVLLAAVDVPGAGRGAALIDPTGGVISVWQPGPHLGARVGELPGTRCWSELITTDIAAARAFYAEVFGWSITSSDVGGSEYSVALVAGRGVAGLVQPPPEVGLPTHWSVTFAVADCDSAVATVRRLGGTVALGPTDVPDAGRFAAIAAPGGENFSILAPAPRPGDPTGAG